MDASKYLTKKSFFQKKGMQGNFGGQDEAYFAFIFIMLIFSEKFLIPE